METIIRSKHPHHADLDRAAERMEPMPLTPKSERSRGSYGSLIDSLQSVRGLCPKARCFRKDGHAGDCYPR